MTPAERSKLIGVVGPCAAGKTTLVSQLKLNGYQARHIAQEHSYVADMWARITDPDVLIFLDASYSTTITRRQLNWSLDDYDEQHRRLQHARQHADLYLLTDGMNSKEVLEAVLRFLNKER